MLYKIKLTKGPDWALTKSRYIGASSVGEGRLCIARLTFNHSCVNRWRNEVEIGNAPDVLLELTGRDGYTRMCVVKNYTFLWKDAQGNDIGRADILININMLDVGADADIGAVNNVYLIFKKG